jgi:hypothetical protein
MTYRIVLALLICSMLCRAQQNAQQQARQEAPPDDAGSFLASRYESRAAGISFRPPAGGERIKPAVIGTNIVQFSNRDDRWSLNVTQLVFDKPSRLIPRDNPATPEVDEGRSEPGLIEQTVKRIQTQNASTQVLRQDLINVGKYDAALIVLRWTEGAQTWLRQIALVQRSELHFYSFDFRTPSGRLPTDKEEEEDPGETKAVEIFNAILDSVILLDQRPLEYDRDERLIRTRGLFLQWPAKIPAVLASEQYFRVTRGGKDVGWMYVVEEPGQRNGIDGYYVATLSQVMSPEGQKFDSAIEAFCAKDRKSEAWVTITVVEGPDKTKTHYSEFGQSEPRMVRVRLDDEGPNAQRGGRAEPARVERTMLTVTQTSKAGASQPMTRELPPYYLPHALTGVLPRLVPEGQPKGYLFVVWAPTETNLVFRYIDAEREKKWTLGGRSITATRIIDRIGLEGDPTFHYVFDGKYFGSDNPTTGVSVIAVNQQAFGQLYPDAKVGRPRVLDMPQQAPGR